MARVTVEDCILTVPNRFDLVLLAASRAKQISSGTPLTIERDNDKDSVVSLREIADKTISIEQLSEHLVQSFFKKPVSDIADRKLLTKGEEIPADVEEAFKDAAQHIATQQKSAAEDVELEADAEEGESEGEAAEAELPENMSFGEDNVDAQD